VGRAKAASAAAKAMAGHGRITRIHAVEEQDRKILRQDLQDEQD
jgi:hypothetical protein